jgi:hypothetical protein
MPSLNLALGYWSFVCAGLALISSLLFYYGLKVRSILTKMEFSQSLYASLVKKIDGILIPWVIMVIPVMVCSGLFMAIPFFFRNMYILVNTVMCNTQLYSTWVFVAELRAKRMGEKKGQSRHIALDPTPSSSHAPSPQHSHPSSMIEPTLEESKNNSHHQDRLATLVEDQSSSSSITRPICASSLDDGSGGGREERMLRTESSSPSQLGSSVSGRGENV